MPPLSIKKSNNLQNNKSLKQYDSHMIQTALDSHRAQMKSVQILPSSAQKKKSTKNIVFQDEQFESSEKKSNARILIANDVNGDIELFQSKIRTKMPKMSILNTTGQGSPANRNNIGTGDSTKEYFESTFKRNNYRGSVQIQEPTDFYSTVQKAMRGSELHGSNSRSRTSGANQLVDPREKIKIHRQIMQSIEARDASKPKNRQQSMLNPLSSHNFMQQRQSNFSMHVADGNLVNRIKTLQQSKTLQDGNMTNNTRSSRDLSEESQSENEDYQQDQKRKQQLLAAQTKKSKTKKSIVVQVENMTAIFSKPIEEREKYDKDRLVQFLRNGVPFLADVQLPLLQLLSDKLEPVDFKAGEVIMTKGDEATCMYIIYLGKVGIFADVDCTIQFAECIPNQVFGEKALENDNKRGASIKALTDCKLLRLKKLYFKSIVLFQALEFLKMVDVLKGWSLIKLQNFNKFLTERAYKPGDYIYKQGDESSTFFIIRKGSVLAETIIDIDEYNRYPIVTFCHNLKFSLQGIKTWEIVKKTKRIRYKVHEISKAQIFGHDELLLDTPRQMTMRALEETNILYLNKETFLSIVESEDMKVIRERVTPIDVEKIAQSILNIKTNTRLRNDAILNATQLNLPSESIRDGGLVRQQLQINRLKPWLEKIRSIQKNNSLVRATDNRNQASTSNLDDDQSQKQAGTIGSNLDDSDDDLLQNEELKKVKVLKIIKEKIQVSGNEYLKAQEFKASDLKSRSRLARDLSPSNFQ
eukprot:403367377